MSCGGAIVSSSEVATIVSGVAGAGATAGVDGGVVPVCGKATVVTVVWLHAWPPRGDEVLVVVELSLPWFGVGGTISMKVLVAAAALMGAPMYTEDPSVERELAAGRPMGVMGAGAAVGVWRLK